MRNFLYIVIILIFIFAVYREKIDSPHLYINAIPNENDSKSMLYKKLTRCLNYEITTIKWRRSYICAVISTVLIFLMVYYRIPEPKEIVLYILIFYIVYYMSWKDFTKRVSCPVENIGQEIIKNLKIKYKQTYNTLNTPILL